MISDASSKIGVDRLHVQNFDKEAREFVTLCREISGARSIVRIVGQELWIVHAEHSGARAGRRHDIVKSLEDIDDLTCDGGGVSPVPRIEGGLTATGLSQR